VRVWIGLRQSENQMHKPDNQMDTCTHLVSRCVLMVVEIGHGGAQRRVGTRVGASMTRSRCLCHGLL